MFILRHAQKNGCKARLAFYGISASRYHTDTSLGSNCNGDQISSIRSTIRNSPFSNRKTKGFLQLGLDTYPNPLLSMEKEQLSLLTVPEYMHLLKLPYGNFAETNKFCITLAEIINDIILLDANKASILLREVNDESIRENIISVLRQDLGCIKGSILEFIISPFSQEFKSVFVKDIKYILSNQDRNAVQKCEILLNFLSKLAKLDQVNNEPILLDTKLFNKIRKVIPGKRRAELYLYFLNLNIQTRDYREIEKMKKKLIKGSNIEKFIVRTGWIDAKWHDVNRGTFGDKHESKMQLFFSVKDLVNFAQFAIKSNDIVSANLYLRLLVGKFEHKCENNARGIKSKRANESSLDDDVHDVLNIVLLHTLHFKGPSYGNKILRYMLNNGINVSFKTLLLMVQELRIQGYHQESLTILNHINLDKLQDPQRRALVEEIINLIKDKYPTSAKILIGYIASCFNGNNSGTSSLDILNRLQLLSVSFNSGELGHVETYSSILRANLDERLMGFDLSHDDLSTVYEVVLASLPRSQVTSDFIQQLYSSYITMINEKSFDLFNKEKLSDKILTLFMKYLLKDDVSSSDMNITTSKNAFEVAKDIFVDFHQRNTIKRKNSTVYLYDLMIYSSLMFHSDYHFALQAIKLSRAKKLPFSFNQIYPFINYHCINNHPEKAQIWYDELVKNGVKTTAAPAKDLFRLARQFNWSVNGFTYRKLGIERNHKKRKEFKTLEHDAINLDGMNIEDEVTEELIDEKSGQDNATNFNDELATLVLQTNNN